MSRLKQRVFWVFLFLLGYYYQARPKSVHGHDNGLALTPPLGWRSWNLYQGNPQQSQMMRIMEGLVRRERKDHLGNVVSLADLGYRDVGLDDTWQRCNSPDAADGMHYHDVYGNPIVNYDRFPSLSAMTQYARDLNLTAGWYANNCACSDHCRNRTECDLQISGDVKALIKYGFSSLKIDGCGNQTDLQVWNKYLELFTMGSSPILVENCHGGNPNFKPNRTLPPAEGCPYHMYRTSSDIRNHYPSIMQNLGSVETYRQSNSSYPGCWAYADMLFVGIGDGLSFEETRSHFGGWAIVSSPLILSHDVNDDSVTNRIWDIISNREVLEVNQAYFGDSGGVYDTSNETITLQHGRYKVVVPVYQYLSKPLGVNKVAVLLMNSDEADRELNITFADVPGLDDGTDGTTEYSVRCLWAHQDKGTYQKSFRVVVNSHDALFFLVEKTQRNLPSTRID